MAMAEPVEGGSRRVLVLAPYGRDASMAVQVLAGAKIDCRICAGLEALHHELADEAAAALITEEAFAQAGGELIFDWVDAQPAWSDFPFVVLTSSRSSSAPRRRLQLMDKLKNVALLERPLDAVTLVSAVQTALRARERQYEVRGHIEERKRAAQRLEELVAARTHQLQDAYRRLRAEVAERERTEEALRQAQKMEAIGQMTGGVAHDFNNLLTAVLGNLELALRRTEDERLRRYLTGATEAAQRGARLTEQLLAFSRKQRLEPESVDLNGLVSGMQGLLHSTLGPTVRIDTTMQVDLWPAMVDATQLELAILNLAINSRDAMPGGGQITVGTSNSSGSDAGRPSDLGAGDFVVVSVADTGTGMSEEVLAHAFEPFFTTKTVGGGTGLGLSQVYGFARQSGGSVRIDTGPGRGTTVCVYVPRAANRPGERTADAPAPPLARKETTILVVDDDRDVRRLAVAGLESLGYTIVEGESGQDALKALASSNGIDLLLVDFAMPEQNGVEVIRLVKEKRPELPVVLMTGYAVAAGLQKGDAAGPILKKPFTLAELAAQIDTALHRGRHLNS
jgi:signal transduction histidine kinase